MKEKATLGEGERDSERMKKEENQCVLLDVCLRAYMHKVCKEAE